MSMSFASSDWAAALAGNLEHDATVRTESVTWVFGPLHLAVEADQSCALDATTIRIDLHEGAVRSVESLASTDAGLAPVTISGSLARWKAVFAGTLDIVDAILQAQLRSQGDLPTLQRHRALLAAIATAGGSVATEWQDEREPAAQTS